MWFNLDGHLAKNKIKESEVQNDRKSQITTARGGGLFY